jgi:hypothetical protein
MRFHLRLLSVYIFGNRKTAKLHADHAITERHRAKAVGEDFWFHGNIVLISSWCDEALITAIVDTAIALYSESLRIRI